MVPIIKLRFLILPVLVMIAASGCLKNEWEQKEKHEKDIIQAYLKDHNITEEQKTEGGIYFLEKVTGTGLTPNANDYVIINYTGRYMEDGSIHETSYDSLKDDWNNADLYKFFVYGPLKFQYGYSIAGINEGLSLMKEGGKAQLIIPSDMAFYDFNPLIYDIELLRVIRNPIHYEDSVLQVYLAEKGFDSTTLHINKPDTVYYRETANSDPGNTHYFQQGDTLAFRFTGRLVDGYAPELRDDRIFDSNMGSADKPVVFVYGASKPASGSILSFPAGLKATLDTLRAGTHATVVLPQKEAFGDKGLFYPTYGYTIVPKYQTVVYDIIVESIKSSQ